MTERRIALAIHGGAGPLSGRDYSAETGHMTDLVELGRSRLSGGASSLDVVCEIVAEMEASGLYVAGRGASPNAAGAYELDACVMSGPEQRVGAVAALVGFQSPVAAARAVMDRTRHVMIAGEGAASLSQEWGLNHIDDPAAWFTHAGGGGPHRKLGDLETGTVGCVALDQAGALAAATSTAGVFGKLAGRVGDTPIAGAGCWADQTAAVSCTGAGEMFVRAAVAAQIAHRMRFGGEGLTHAAGESLLEALRLGGEGGLIALSATGEIAMPYTSAGMKRAALHPDGKVEVKVFE